MRPIIDPRQGDVEDDASSTKSRSLLSLAGSLIGEISFSRLVLAWILLVAVPALILGLAPMVAIAWIHVVWGKVTSPLDGLGPVVLLAALVALGWLGGAGLFRLAEGSFWSLNSLTVEPAYTTCREGLRHLAERLLPDRVAKSHLGRLRAASAIAAGLALSMISVAVLAFAWAGSQWVAGIPEFASTHRLAKIALVNSIVVIAAYLAGASLVWAFADATMAQPRDLERFGPQLPAGRTWRIAHLSDIHVVGERYGFRIESGRSGPRGNQRMTAALARLDAICAHEPADLILITGDITDAGRSTEWAEFLDALSCRPRVADRVLLLPGNHDLNVVDRANPARLDLPTSPNRRLRQMRALSAMVAVQGNRVRVIDRAQGRLGPTLAEAAEPHLSEMAAFADTRPRRLSKGLHALWTKVFPMVVAPDAEDGLGVLLLNSNADTHFSFTNALGVISGEQMQGIEIAAAQYPRAGWVIALHHHPVEYPRLVDAFSERLGTALINGNWFIRKLKPLAGRMLLMHGHRHIDWIGECGGLPIVSAPSPVMEADGHEPPHFYIQTVAMSGAGLRLLPPQCIRLSADC